MNQVLLDAIIVFITQLVFIGSRTVNVKAIAEKNMIKALYTGAIIHIAWLVNISIGVVSMKEILKEFNWQYIPVILCSLSGGLLGTYWGLKEKIYGTGK